MSLNYISTFGNKRENSAWIISIQFWPVPYILRCSSSNSSQYFSKLDLLFLLSLKQEKVVFSCIGCWNEITKNDDLLGYISHMSPVMTTGAKKNVISTPKMKQEEQSVFPQRKNIVIRVQKQKSLVKISKFQINLNSPSKDITLYKDTQISPTVLSRENAFTAVTVSINKVTPLDALKYAVPEILATKIQR